MNNTMDGFIITSLISINCKKDDFERLIRDQSHRFPRLIPSSLCDLRKCDLQEYIPTTSDGPETHLGLDCRCLNGSWSRSTSSPNMKIRDLQFSSLSCCRDPRGQRVGIDPNQWQVPISYEHSCDLYELFVRRGPGKVSTTTLPRTNWSYSLPPCRSTCTVQLLSAETTTRVASAHPVQAWPAGGEGLPQVR